MTEGNTPQVKKEIKIHTHIPPPQYLANKFVKAFSVYCQTALVPPSQPACLPSRIQNVELVGIVKV